MTGMGFCELGVQIRNQRAISPLIPLISPDREALLIKRLLAKLIDPPWPCLSFNLVSFCFPCDYAAGHIMNIVVTNLA